MLISLPLALLAQTAPDAAPPSTPQEQTPVDEGNLGTAQQGPTEVVVTARRRSEHDGAAKVCSVYRSRSR